MTRTVDDAALVGPPSAGARVLSPMSYVPGLALVATAAGVAFGLHAAVSAVSPLVMCVAVGVVMGNLGFVPIAADPGVRLAARRLLRLGVVLLGFNLSLSQVVALGGPGFVVVAAVVTATFFGTRWLGRQLGASEGLSLLVATGFAICGASAVAAMEGVSDASEEDVAFAIGLVTLFGSLAVVVLPLLAPFLGLDGAEFGAWVGASVHDVAQVVATAAWGGAAAMEPAVVVKLTRVVLLAPMIAGVAFGRRRAQSDASAEQGRPPVIPLFVAAFLVAAGLRSVGVVPLAWLDAIEPVETALLGTALVALGIGVRLRSLRRLGMRPLLLGAAAWIVVASVSYVGVVLIR